MIYPSRSLDELKEWIALDIRCANAGWKHLTMPAAKRQEIMDEIARREANQELLIEVLNPKRS